MRVLVILILVGATLAVPTPFRASRASRIIGGVPTTVEKYPFMANMRSMDLPGVYSQACGGSLISRNAVVSAAHCTYNEPSINWRVRLGTSLIDEPSGTDHTLIKIINHEYYDRPSYVNNDVCVVILREPAVYSVTVAPIKLASKLYDLPDNTVVTTIGWGSLTPEGGVPNQLQEVDLNVIPQEICVERYHALKQEKENEPWPDITETMLCAGILDVGGADACEGDSGGPLIHRTTEGDVLVGIVSWGNDCADPYYPGVNARVSALSDWIIRNAST